MAAKPNVPLDVARAIWRALTNSQYSVGRRVAIVCGFVASGFRLAAGTVVGRLGPRPAKPLILWDRESDAHCRAVRESLSSLDLDVEIRPCPQGGTRFVSQVKAGGLPQLEDPNQGKTLNGSAEILAWLHQQYGTGKAPGFRNSGLFIALSGFWVSWFTWHRGTAVRASVAPVKPLEVWAFESSPFCRLVRETLCEYEVPWLLHNVAKGSPRRAEFVARSGKMQVPWLVDSNTGVQMFESLQMQQYIATTYGPK